VDLRTLSDAEVRRLEGVGDAIAALIGEYAATGRLRMLDELRAAEPSGFGELLTLPLIGVRDARALASTHGFDSIAALREAAGRGDGLAGLDDRLAHRVRESLRRTAATAGDGVPLPRAGRDAEALAAALGEIAEVDRVQVAGDVRRSTDTVQDLSLVLVTDEPAATVTSVTEHPAVVRVIERTDAMLQVMTATGRRATLLLTTASRAGEALLRATGPATHVAAVVARAAQRGVALDGADEEAVYAAIGLPYIAPELRDRNDLDAPIPSLVRHGDIRGDLHVHSDWSGDGVDTLEDMVEECLRRGYEYVAITDHAENLRINGMTREAVTARRRTIGELQQRHPYIRILDAAELNIGLDGSLDYDLDFLMSFDLTVASIHSEMHRGVAEQTDRILAAIAHPAVDVVGHPTGRILGRRPPYDIELTAIAQAAAETGTALEVNGSPARLDLSGAMIRQALEAGATVSLSSDAHSVAELGYIEHAVRIARHGWATPTDVVNCRPPDEVGRVR